LKIKAILPLALLLMLAQAAYATGIDTKLPTDNEIAYRRALDEAWSGMNDAQQKAYNWAVGDASLSTLAIKYPELTPRQVVERETDEYIARKTTEIADMQAELSANADKLAREENTVQDVQAELAKLTITGTRFQTVLDVSRQEELRFNFTVTNASRFNIASAKWDAWLFLDAREAQSPESGRYCQIISDYTQSGGLASGQSKPDFITLMGVEESDVTVQCPRWNTLAVQQAAAPVVKITLDAGSALDFNNERILPHVSRTRADYERDIANAQDDLKTAQSMRASLGG